MPDFVCFLVFLIASPTILNHGAARKVEILWWLAAHITFFLFPEDEARKSVSYCGQSAHISLSYCLSFFVLELSLLTVSLWISFLVLYMQMK